MTTSTFGYLDVRFRAIGHVPNSDLDPGPPALSLLATPTTLPQLPSGVHYFNNIWLGVPVVKLLNVQFFQSTVAS